MIPIACKITNFSLYLSKEITKIAQSSEVQHYLINNHTTWNFIVERALGGGGGFGKD